MSMDNNSLVSVIIPTYNRAKVTFRAINSVLVQTYSNLEIILVDDHSDDWDELSSHLDKINDARLHSVRHEKNLGGSAARNTGIKNAKGDFVAFLDSDDEWLPSKIKSQLDLLKYDSTKAILCYTQSTVFTQNKHGEVKQSIMPKSCLRTDEKVGDYLFSGSGWLPTPSMLLPSWLAKEVQFNSNLKRHQDYDFLLRLESRGCTFCMVREPMVIVHWEDFHQSKRGLNAKSSLSFLKEYSQYLSTSACSGFVYQQIVMRLFRGSERLQGLKYLFLYVRPWHISFPKHLYLISVFLFGDNRIVEWLIKIRNRFKAC